MPASPEISTRCCTNRGKRIVRLQSLPKGQACDSCYRRRIKCSGERPACASCIRSAKHLCKEILCVYTQSLTGPRRRSKAKPKDDNDEMKVVVGHLNLNVSTPEETEDQSSLRPTPILVEPALSHLLRAFDFFPDFDFSTDITHFRDVYNNLGDQETLSNRSSTTVSPYQSSLPSADQTADQFSFSLPSPSFPTFLPPTPHMLHIPPLSFRGDDMGPSFITELNPFENSFAAAMDAREDPWLSEIASLSWWM